MLNVYNVLDIVVGIGEEMMNRVFVFDYSLVKEIEKLRSYKYIWVYIRGLDLVGVGGEWGLGKVFLKK